MAYDLSDYAGTPTYGTGLVNQCFVSSGGPSLHNVALTFPDSLGHRWEFSFKTTATGVGVLMGNAQDVYIGINNVSGKIYIQGNTGPAVTLNSTVTANDGNWHTGYLEFGPSGFELSIDAETPVTDGTPYVAGGLGTDVGFYIGAFGAGFPWDGSIDEVTLKQGGTTVALYHLDNDGTDSSGGGGPPVTPVITNIDLLDGGLTGVTLHIATPSFGTPSYTYQWHRSTTVNFTPSGGTAISGATSQSYADTSMVPGTWYYFRVVVTGSDAGEVTSYCRPAQTLGPAISIGYIGDSTGTAYSGNDSLAIADRIGRALRATNRSRIVTVENRSVSGLATSDWVSGSGYMTSALAAFASASVTHVFVRLGMNDAQGGASSITTNLQDIVDTLIGAGLTVLVSEPNFREPGSHAPTSPGTIFDESTTPLLLAYRTNIATVVAATPGCYYGDKEAFMLTAQRGVELLYDRIHPNAEGTELMAQADLRALRAVLGETAAGFMGP